jgi:D-glycero-D-manno-heptose 1,7-bisphosphate phosphatase
MAGKPAIFLDRDGTIIYDVGYPKHPEQVKLMPGIISALKTLRKKGFLLIVVSNQSGIGRGYITSEEAENVHKTFISLLFEADIIIDRTYYCPHAPETNCSCRKPLPSMLFDAAENLNINLESSFMIGDRIADIEAGKRAGCMTILIEGNPERSPDDINADCLAENWQAAVKYIIENSQ